MTKKWVSSYTNTRLKYVGHNKINVFIKVGDYFYHVTLTYRILSVASDASQKHTITGITYSINEQIKII